MATKRKFGQHAKRTKISEQWTLKAKGQMQKQWPTHKH